MLSSPGWSNVTRLNNPMPVPVSCISRVWETLLIRAVWIRVKPMYVSSSPPETPPVPDGLDWDLWLGPAPVRPYHPAYHPWTWRNWLDFGTGLLGDLGCHKLSTVFKALKLGHPTSVEASSTKLNAEIFPLFSLRALWARATGGNGREKRL